MSTYRLADEAVLDCDVLVIGSGAGGGTLAQMLVNRRRDVLMLEEGPYLPADHVPVSVPDAFLRMWRCGGLTAGVGNPPVSYAEGRCVGGGTEINSAIMQRAPDALLDEWAGRYGIEGYGAEKMAPYYDWAERIINARLTPGPLGRASDILKEAGEKLGWEVTALKRAQKDCVGTNLCSVGCPTGAKQAMTRSTLPEALNKGMRLIAECRVTKLVIDGGRVTSVKAVARDWMGGRHKVTIYPRQVFLCAGAVHTPALLLRSGIKRAVGRNLRMHPTIKALATFNDEVQAEHSRLPLYAITEFMPDQRLGGSVSLPGFFAMGLAEDWSNRRHLWALRKHVGSYYAMVRAEATGTIMPLPGVAEPMVRYQCTPRDLGQLVQGLGRLAEAMFASGAREVIPSIQGHKGWRSMDAVRADLARPIAAGHLNLMTIHIFSSCPPGEKDDLCATDSYGRVRGLANLILADASQIPEAPGVNPQLTIMATALRHADMFLNRSLAEATRSALKEAA